jgi:hypothetical protein
MTILLGLKFLFTAEAQRTQRIFVLCLPLIPQACGTGIPANIKKIALSIFDRFFMNERVKI